MKQKKAIYNVPHSLCTVNIKTWALALWTLFEHKLVVITDIIDGYMWLITEVMSIICIVPPKLTTHPSQTLLLDLQLSLGVSGLVFFSNLETAFPVSTGNNKVEGWLITITACVSDCIMDLAIFLTNFNIETWLVFWGQSGNEVCKLVIKEK